MFFDDSFEVGIIVNYDNSKQMFSVSLSYKNNIPDKIFCSNSVNDIFSKMRTGDGFSIITKENQKINIKYNRSLFCGKWKVNFESVELHQIKF
jgi:hypothetical protein